MLPAVTWLLLTIVPWVTFDPRGPLREGAVRSHGYGYGRPEVYPNSRLAFELAGSCAASTGYPETLIMDQTH